MMASSEGGVDADRSVVAGRFARPPYCVEHRACQGRRSPKATFGVLKGPAAPLE